MRMQVPDHLSDGLVSEEGGEGPLVSLGSGLTSREEQKGSRRTMKMRASGHLLDKVPEPPG